MNKALNEEIRKEERVLDQINKLFQTLTRTKIDISSKTCLTGVLYEKFKYEVVERTRAGRPSVNTRTLKYLKEIEGSNHITSLLSDIAFEGKLVIKAEELSKTKYPLASIVLAYRREKKVLNAMYSLRNKLYSKGGI